jgi:UDP-glucose 4-epimerase
MDIKGKKFLVIGGAGFIGSHVVAELLKHDVKEVIIFDNYARGKSSNLREQLQDPRCSIFPDGGDIREVDVLNKARKLMAYFTWQPCGYFTVRTTREPHSM